MVRSNLAMGLAMVYEATKYENFGRYSIVLIHSSFHIDWEFILSRQNMELVNIDNS